MAQRLGQLEDARHVRHEYSLRFIVVSTEAVAVEAASEGGEQLSKAADTKESTWRKSMQGSGAGRGGTGTLQRRDLGLVEHSRDRLAALGKKGVVREAAQQRKGAGEKRHRLVTRSTSLGKVHVKFKGV